MHYQVEKKSFPELLKSHFSYLYKNQAYSDIIILSRNASFDCHRVVLAARSINWGVKGGLSSRKVINLNRVEDDIVENIIKWCYMDHTVISDKVQDVTIIKYLALASSLGLKLLEDLCVQKIKERKSNCPLAAEILNSKETQSVSSILNVKQHPNIRDHDYCFNIASLCRSSIDDNNNSSNSIGISNKDKCIQVQSMNAFNSEECGTITYVVPTCDIKKLFISWKLDSLSTAFKCGSYIGQMVNHQGYGSLWNILRSAGWINTLIAGQKVDSRGFGFFVVNIDLTEAGLEAMYDVVKLLLQYLALLRYYGPQKWVFEMCRDLESMQFRSHVQGRSHTALAGLQLYPGEDMVTKTSDNTSEWRPDLITEMLDRLTPGTVRVTVAAEKFAEDCWEVLPCYGAKYRCEKIAAETIQHWDRDSCGLHPKLELPQKKSFVVLNLEVMDTRSVKETKEVAVWTGNLIKKSDKGISTNIDGSDRCYTDEYYKMCTLLMFKSLGCYKLMRKLQTTRYPHPNSIRNRVRGFACEPGLNDEMFELLRAKLQSYPPGMKRQLALAFDEMSVHPKNAFSMHFQRVIPAAHKCMVVMVRGIGANFKEILFYDFDCHMTKDLLHAILVRIEGVGGSVRALTMDLGNPTLQSELHLARGAYYLENPSNKKKIFIFPDVPHQLKNERTHTLVLGLTFTHNGETHSLSKDDFEAAVDHDGKLGQERKLYKIR